MNSVPNPLARRRQQRLAHGAVNRARGRGELVRPSACGRCGSTGRWIDCHHDCYCDAHRLDCTWLCTTCHAKARHPIDARCVYEEVVS